MTRHAHRGWTSLPDEERDRASKKNFYRVLKRFATRRDLLVTRADPGLGVARRRGSPRWRTVPACLPITNSRRAVIKAEASQSIIVPPAVWHGEASFPARRRPGDAGHGRVARPAGGAHHGSPVYSGRASLVPSRGRPRRVRRPLPHVDGPTRAGGVDPVEPELTDAVPEAPPSRRRRVLVGSLAVLVAVAMLASAWPDGPRPVAPTPAIAADPSTVTIVAGAPASIDPAKHGDLGSASFVSQLYETLTAVDTSLAIRPALAESWAVTDEGRKVTFTLRPGLEFSDGSPLRAEDVVHSWRRLFIPGDPSPLASLIADVEGARELLTGASSDTSTLGVRAEGDRTVVVDMVRGGGDLPAIVSGAPFAIVPASVGDGEIMPDRRAPGGQRRATRWSASTRTPSSSRPTRRYWAGTPAIETVRMLTTLEGAEPGGRVRGR